ncbi:hypothetical protein [Armatimonas sp.]
MDCGESTTPATTPATTMAGCEASAEATSTYWKSHHDGKQPW